MSTRTIHRGATRAIDRDIGTGDTLRIQGGAPGGAGGTGIVSGAVTNAGTIELLGGLAGSTPGGQGGSLLVTGVLTNSGTLLVDAGRYSFYDAYSGKGAVLDLTGTLVLDATASLTIGGGVGEHGATGGTLLNDGVLTNAGQLDLVGADRSPYLFESNLPTGGLLVNAGSLANTGTIFVGGGLNSVYFHPDGGLGAVLDDTGTLTSSGLLELGGGAGGGYLGTGGYGGELDVAGVLTNTGTLQIDGGDRYQGSYAYGGLGGVLSITGVATNDGLIDVRAGVAADSLSDAGGGGQMTVAGSLANTGTIRLDGGHPGEFAGFTDNGATLTIAGSVSSSGTILLGGGAEYSTGGALLLLSDTANLTNTGTIVIGGGAASADDYPGGAGATLRVDGEFQFGVHRLENDGVLVVQAGQPGSGVAAGNTSGAGGTLSISTYAHLYNSGSIMLQGGATGIDGGAGSQGAQMVLAGRLLMETDATFQIGGSDGGGAATLTLTGVIDNDSSNAVVNDGMLDMKGGYFESGPVINNGTIDGYGGFYNNRLVNNGTIDVTSRAMDVEAGLAASPGQHGTVIVDTGAALDLTFGHLDTAGETIVLQPNAVVDLDDAELGVAIVSSNGTLDLFDSGRGTLAAADTNLTVFLADAANLTLSQLAFVTAIGSAGADTITALSSGQTLTGGAGTDHLNGAAATGDTFRDTAAGLNTDVIGGFAGSDAIDITDIAAAGAQLAYVQNGSAGTLTVTGGTASTAIVLTGTFTAGSFATATDQHGGPSDHPARMNKTPGTRPPLV